MSRIGDHIRNIQLELGPGCRLIVVSKFRTVDEIMEAYRAGHRVFAENRVQALLERKAALPEDIEWHLIGHLQRNKVKYIAPFISMIHSVDSFRLLSEINLEAAKNNRVIDCLLQVFVATEETKFGMTEDELEELLQNPQLKDLKNIRLCGLMAMASLTTDTEQIHREFEHANQLFYAVRSRYFSQDTAFRELSTGMSGDYRIALQHGSTMVRIGSAVFE